MTLVPVCQDKSWLYQSTKETIVISHVISNSHALTTATKDEQIVANSLIYME